MARFPRGNNLRPVNSRKHIVDSQGGLVAGTQQLVTISHAVDNPALAQNADVATGARINSLYLNVQVAATGTAALANVYMFIAKNPAGALNFPNGNVTGISDLKKFIFHTEMIMTEKNTTAIPRTLFRGVLRIPRQYTRQGADDFIQVALFAPGVNFDFCIQAIYKDYR